MYIIYYTYMVTWHAKFQNKQISKQSSPKTFPNTNPNHNPHNSKKISYKYRKKKFLQIQVEMTGSVVLVSEFCACWGSWQAYKNGTYEWVSCHHEWVIVHIWMSHGTHMNESWHPYEWVMAPIWMSHGTHINEASLI